MGISLPLDLNVGISGFTQIPTGTTAPFVGDSGCSSQSERKGGVVASEEQSMCPVLLKEVPLSRFTERGKALCFKPYGPGIC